MKPVKPKVSFAESLGILLILLAILGFLIIGQKLSPHIPILFVFMLLLFYGKWKGFSWDEIHAGITAGITPGIVPIIIFLLIGVLVATWILSGTIPTIMVYGFKIISVKFFLPTVFVVCSLVGVTVGSSFTTISTMGIAFLGIGHILGFNNAMTAGAVVSGAFLGNNISPLSDTTNLAAGIGEVNLFEHIMNMMWTVIPAFVLSIIGYIFLGHQSVSADLNTVDAMVNTLQNGFWISPVTLIPVGILFLFAWKKVPAIPTLLVGSTAATLLAFVHNPSLNLQKVSSTLMSGYIATTGDKSIDTLLSRGGIESMLSSASLIILALALGGLLIKFEIIATLIDKIRDYVDNPAKLVGLTALSSIMVNVLVGEQYLSIILPGETFKSSFDRLKIDKKYLTRTIADAGAAVNSIIPWGVSGTFIMGTLKVSALAYLPYAFFPLLCPIITIILGLQLKHKQVHQK
ncbi:Na+/H+ antiporter NhaC [Enterococcus phoeniculicola]|uniref:Na+/H+ antiporter NhaC n=1 Tax=Enterococcus phoeniculicola ATCC BAA-412 TaxID=1158610 RepID=R3W2U2_9ENTE|nr:Na+/H+ antiporter NhaC [Enterococcus phoeniculicola]EOL41967.1 Na+/H+ antiporter NhaC [Enterococcus phoeniculicola ATCC BAA-412]EOT79754.1 Na+/H+ antiporter NhaC [Enterococcus phoeniculicola ATCC BAA-412]OJG70074.1 Na+/H+ antiporter NhaC [Enterococcus phoeniculicola]